MEQSSDVLSRAAAIISRCGQVRAYSNQFRVLADQLRLLMENMGCELSAVKTGKLIILFLEFNSFLDEMDMPYKPSATNIRDETSVDNADENAHQTALNAFSKRIIESIVSISRPNSVNIAEEKEKMALSIQADQCASS